MKDVWTLIPCLLALLLAGGFGARAEEALKQDDFFPIVLYNHWNRTSVAKMCSVIDDAQRHGFNTVNLGVSRPSPELKAIAAHVQKRGMAISGFCDSLIPFRAGKVPACCVRSPDYKALLHERYAKGRAEYESVPRLWATDLMDELCVRADRSHRDPAHSHVGFVCHCERCRQAFKARYGADLPDAMPPADQPALRRHYVDFCNDYWAEVWTRSRDYMKANKPGILVANTYTESICLGRHVELVFGDLLKWAKPCDWLAADIYPYYFGRHENDAEAIEWALKRSRLLMAYLRCAAQHHGIPFAWWVGCTSSVEETPRAIRHVSYTAIGQGAQGLLGWGAYFPEKRPLPEYNPALWDDAGKTFRAIASIGPLLRHLKKTSRIALLCPETEALFVTARQYNGPFYYDGVPTYDALLKVFGNADLVYERQVAAGKLKDYEALVVTRVRHISDAAANAIRDFVAGGGKVISDTVPELNEDDKPSSTLAKVFGRTERKRLHAGAPDAFPATVTTSHGKGKVLLLRFRLASFYRVPALWALLRAWLQGAGVHPLAVSSNSDVESNYLAGDGCFVVVAVNRRRSFRGTRVTCTRPPFVPRRVRDLIDGKELPFTWRKEGGQDALSVEVGVEALSGRVIGVYP